MIMAVIAVYSIIITSLMNISIIFFDILIIKEIKKLKQEYVNNKYEFMILNLCLIILDVACVILVIVFIIFIKKIISPVLL